MKKPLWISASVLAILLAAGIANAAGIGRLTEACRVEVEAAQTAAASENWDAAEAALGRAYECWEHAQTYFHIVLIHEELDEAEALFAQLHSFAEYRDTSNFCVTAAELQTQLGLLSETQEISVKNVL